MQKKLLGMAVAAALGAPGLALAQSAVQVYGTIHLSGNQTKFDGGPAGFENATKYGINSHASNWGLRSTETLGGGMTAWLQLEFNMQMERRNDLPSGVGSPRNSGLGLRGAWGNVYYGTWESPWAQTFRLWDVGTIGGWGPTTSIIGRREATTIGVSRNCTNLSAGATNPAVVNTPLCNAATQAAPTFGSATAASTTPTNLGYPLWRRFGSSLFYESPVFGGLQGKIAFQPNETKATNTTAASTTTIGTTGTPVTIGVPGVTQENPSAWSASLTWSGLGGRARAFIANMRAKDWSSVGQTDMGWTVGGGFDFGVANVGATYETYKYKPAQGEIKAKQWGVGLAVPLGPGKIGASYAKAKDLEGGGAPLSNDTGAKMWNLGYEWALSKRTAVGFGVAKMDNKANAGFTWTGQTNGTTGGTETVGAGQDQRNVFVSIRHSF